MRQASQTRSRASVIQRAFTFQSDDLNKDVVTGVSFQFLGIALRIFITIGSTAVLARLLMPSDFGYVAMATVVTEFAALFANFGFNNLLIQQRVINRLQIDTVFWASAGLGVILAFGVFLASFFAGWLFADPLVGDLLRLMCITFLIGGLATVPSVALARLMRYRIQFYIRTASTLMSTLAAISFAFLGFGMWSLVGGAVTGAVVNVLASFIAVPYGPRLRFHSSYLRNTWRTSASYFASGLLFFANTNVDLLLIGRQLGAAPLGYYQNARAFTDEIRARIAMPLQQVLFPTFSALQDNRERMQQMVLRSGRMLAAVVIPIGVGVSVVAQELVPVLYGPKWMAMIPVMGMFGLSAALKASMAIATPLFNATNHVGLAVKYNVIGTALMVVALWAAMPYGINMVAMAMVGVSLYSFVPFRVALGLIGMGWRHVAQLLLFPALAAFAMWVIIFLVRPYSESWSNHPSGLLVMHVGMGAVVYTMTLHLLSRQYLADFRSIITKLVSKK